MSGDRRAVLLAFLFVARTDAHGAGVWKDPGHYVSEDSLAGLRFVAEFPAHKLTMIGTDDGATWWMIQGTCSGPGMTEINFDFSKKGGPPDLKGIWSSDEGAAYITWPDGNKWSAMATPSAAFSTTTVGTAHGLFLDSAHHVPGTFKGVRVFAETPHHVLRLVGSDDGVSWWYLTGDCHGPGGEGSDEFGPFKFVSKTYFAVDFSPKGGPADLVAEWDHHSLIKFPDGNTWYKPDGPALAASNTISESSNTPALALPVCLIAGFVAYAVRKAKAPATPASGHVQV